MNSTQDNIICEKIDKYIMVFKNTNDNSNNISIKKDLNILKELFQTYNITPSNQNIKESTIWITK